MRQPGFDKKDATGKREAQSTRLALFLAAAFFVAAATAPAQSRQLVHCDALIGWNGIARDEHFAPLLVSVENSGPKLTVEVRVVVKSGSSLRGDVVQRTFTREALLSGGATRRIPYVIPLPRGARSLEVSVSSAGAELAHEEVDLRSVSTSDRLVAAVSSELTLDTLAGLSTGGAAVRTVYPRVDDLPESWAGYDGVEMVVVHDTYFQQLRPAQVGAIERWVATGGVLVFTGGADALQHSSAGLSRLLPVEVTGIRERDDLPSLAAYLGRTSVPRGRMVIAESRLTVGTVLASQDGLPLIVQRRLGRGMIWFAAFDPTLSPLGSWDGSLSFWRIMMESDRQPAMQSVFQNPVDDPWMKTLFSDPPLSFPTALVVLVFVGAYLLLFAPLVNRRIAQVIGPRVRTALLLAVPVAACLSGWFLFNNRLFAPGARILEAAKIEMISGDGLALVTEKLGLFAAQAGTCQIILAGSDTTLDEVGPGQNASRAARPVDLTIDASHGTAIHDLAFGRFGSRLFVLKTVVPLPIRASVSGDAAVLECVVVNAAPRALQGCFVSRNGKGYFMGDVAPGATVDRHFAVEDGVSLQDPIALARIAGSARKGDFLSQAGGASVAGTAVVRGWLDGPALSVELSGVQRLSERPPLTLVIVEAR
jgi:hypothetical protein